MVLICSIQESSRERNYLEKEGIRVTDNNTVNAQVKFAGIALLILSFSLLVPSYAQYQVSPLGSVIMKEYDIGIGQISSLFSAPMIPAIFFSLIAGILIDKFGSKGVIGVGLILSTIGCFGRVFSGSFTPLMVSTALTGFAACFINAGSGKILGSFFGAEQVPAKMGILVAASTFGMTVSMFTSARFSSINSAFTVAAILSTISVVIWIIFMKNPKQSTLSDGSNEENNLSTADLLKVVIRCPSVWFVSFAMFFIMAANVVFSSSIPMALGTRGFDSITAANLSASITIGNFIGCFAAPLCIRILKSQKITLIIFALLAAMGVAFAWLVPNSILLTIGFLFTGIFLGGMIPTLLSLPVQFKSIGPVYAGTAGGVVGTIQLLGAVVIPSYVIAPIAGSNFSNLFILSGVCMLIAAFCSLSIREIN